MVKNLSAMQQIAGQKPGFNPWVGKIPGEENGSPLRDSCLESPQNREAWQTTICGVAKSQTRLSIMCQINHKLILNNIFLLLNSLFSSVRCCCFHSVAKSCAILGDPMDCSGPGFPVFHHLPEFAQTHVHWVGDATQPSHSLPPPSPPVLNLSEHQGLFHWFSSARQVAKVLKLQLWHQSFQWILRVDFLSDWLVWSCSLKDSQEFALAPQLKRISSSTLNLLYGSTHTFVHYYRKNHNFD